MPRSPRVAAAVLTVALIALIPTAAWSTSNGVTNGDFETDAAGSGTVTGWTVVDGFIDLGTTEIAGCTTVDTSDYTTLRGWAANARPDVAVDGNTVSPTNGDLYAVRDRDGNQVTVLGLPLWYSGASGEFAIEQAQDDGNGGTVQVTITRPNWDAATSAAFVALLPDPSVRQDDGPADPTFFSPGSRFEAAVVDGSTIPGYDTQDALGNPVTIDLTADSQVLGLSSAMNSDAGYDGYVAHGPAVYSDEFTAAAGRQINLRWAASGAEDDYHVLGYLLNTATCAQTEVIDSTGEYTQWTTASVEIPAAGTYRFVFVGGTFDQTFGGAGGAILFIDNIVQTQVITGTELALELSLAVGDSVQGAPVQMVGGGLRPESAYQLELRSTPRIVYSGVTDASGSFVQSAPLPTDITPGQHTLTLSGIAPDGSAVSDVAYLTVAAGGVLSYLSYATAEVVTPAVPVPTATAVPVATPTAPSVATDTATPAAAGVAAATTLAATGVPTGLYATLAGAFLALGAALMTTSRRRRTR